MGQPHLGHAKTGHRAFGVLALVVLAGCATGPGTPPGAPPRAEAAPALAVAPLPTQPLPKHAAPPLEAPAAAAEPAPPMVPQELDIAPPQALRELQRGRASWYGPRFQGRRTANGERYDMHAMTAAHRTLPFGTVVRVRSLRTGHEVEVRINDRGPYGHDYVIDVSRSAAQALGLLEPGDKDVLLLVPSATPTPADIAAPRAGPSHPRRKSQGIRRSAHRGKPA